MIRYKLTVGENGKLSEWMTCDHTVRNCTKVWGQPKCGFESYYRDHALVDSESHQWEITEL